MKLRQGFVTHKVGDEHVMLAVGAAKEAFRGIATSNETSAFILERLKTETTREAIIDAMLAEYNADRTTIAAGVDKILGKLREIGALEE